ncbi:MAG: fasciclin domain-containing protein [Bacteroidales bacterium]
MGIFLMSWILLSFLLNACEPNTHNSNWVDDEGMRTMGTYLDQHHQDYAKYYRILEEGRMLSTLYGYNPYGEGYTLFLPTDEAIDLFVEQREEYRDFEELLGDTAFLYTLTRYHTVNKKLHTNEFPYGALTDPTLTGDRLTIGFYTEGDNPLYKVNNTAPIVQSNLDMTNGYIQVISEILQKPEISGIDWLRQNEGYSILAGALERSGIGNGLWFNQYTILAEQDSIYQRNGINTVEDLIDRLGTPEIPSEDPDDALFQFAAYHILYGDFYLNDFEMGTNTYWTLGEDFVTIEVGLDIRINPGLQTYGIEVSEYGDTTVIDYIRLIWEDCNNLTRTGPVHSLTELLVSEPFPDE